MGSYIQYVDNCHIFKFGNLISNLTRTIILILCILILLYFPLDKDNRYECSVVITTIILNLHLYTYIYITIIIYPFYSVKDGIFRYYKMGRDKDSMISFIKEQKWEQITSISSWKSPNSIQMSLVAQFFKLSQKVRVSVV